MSLLDLIYPELVIPQYARKRVARAVAMPDLEPPVTPPEKKIYTAEETAASGARWRAWRLAHPEAVAKYRKLEKKTERYKTYQRDWMRRKRMKNPRRGLQRGERVASAKITPAIVVEIRLAYANGEGSFATLAQRFGISYSGARKVIKRITWAHVATTTEEAQ